MYDPLLRRIIVVAAAVEIVVFAWIASWGVESFHAAVSSPDTPEYLQVARALADRGVLIPSRRTLGYPLFLALGYALGGVGYGTRIVVALQLALNLLFVRLCWKLLQRLVPRIDVRLRVAATVVFFWAGLGMALNLLSDFLAAFLFSIFLYGMLFWRRPFACLGSGLCLALATLTRPTFTFVPFLLPVLALLANRVTSKIPRLHLWVFVFFSLSATGVSILYQYRTSGYLGPSSVVTQNISRMLSYDDYEQFRRRIAEYAKVDPGTTLSPAEEERYARELLWRGLAGSPGAVLFPLGVTMVKYLFVPIEYAVAKPVVFFLGDATYFAYVRPALFAACLPIWLLSLIPPLDSPKRLRAYYFLVLILLG